MKELRQAYFLLKLTADWVGCPPALVKKKQKLLVKLCHDKDNSIAEILEMFHIFKSTLFKIVLEKSPEKKVS